MSATGRERLSADVMQTDVQWAYSLRPTRGPSQIIRL